MLLNRPLGFTNDTVSVHGRHALTGSLLSLLLLLLCPTFLAFRGHASPNGSQGPTRGSRILDVHVEGGNATPVTSFTLHVARAPDGARLDWESEGPTADLTTFEVHRSLPGENRNLLASLPVEGRDRFSYLDPAPPAGRADYWLKSIDRSATGTLELTRPSRNCLLSGSGVPAESPEPVHRPVANSRHCLGAGGSVVEGLRYLGPACRPTSGRSHVPGRA